MKKLKIFNVMCLTMLVISSITSCTFGNTLSSSSDNTTSQGISNTSNTSLVSSISFEEEGPINLKIGESHVLKINVENVSSFLIESSNTNIVKVVQTSSSYVLRALSDGSATIYAKVNDEIYDSIEVNVAESAPTSIVISSTSNEALVGSSINISIDIDKQSYLDEVSLNIIEGSNLASIEGSEIYFASSGSVKVQASYQNIKSNILVFYAYDFTISLNNNDIEAGDHERIRISNFDGDKTKCSVIIEDEEILSSGIDAFGYLHINALKVGSSSFYVQSSDGLISNKLVVNVVGGNPYLDIDKNEFYNNYKRATSLLDSQYRSECYLMSGDITPQDQEPEIASNQPKHGNMLIHNTTRDFSNNGNVYTVYNVNGEKEFDIYYGGAYTSLEEVAAYIYAWGEVPVNYDPDKDAQPYNSEWGEYLRVNNTYFKGNTKQYPYEPELPNISGVDNGNVMYYEIDIGTTGTDCDPEYDPEIYNDGNRIIRGAARIVYTYSYINGDPVSDEDRYVFYTYNHYNDFQEYLNYYNGWGEMFGNITGGGTISSKVDYNPTPYVQTYRKDLF